MQPSPIDGFDVLIDSCPGHTTSAPTYRQLALPDVVLDLAEFLILTLQLLLVDPVALYLRQYALVIEMVHRTVDFGVEVVVFLEELELTRSIGAEGSR